MREKKRHKKCYKMIYKNVTRYITKCVTKAIKECVTFPGWVGGFVVGMVIKSFLWFFLFWCMLKFIYIRILIYVLKSCHQDSYVFQNLMSSFDVGGMNLENKAGRWLFRFLVLNLSLAGRKRRSRLPIADSQCAKAVCHPRFRTDASSRWVMPQLSPLSVFVCRNEY